MISSELQSVRQGCGIGFGPGAGRSSRMHLPAPQENAVVIGHPPSRFMVVGVALAMKIASHLYADIFTSEENDG